MLTNLQVAGFGGQGVMVIGKMIGECAFEQGLKVTFMPSYGPEQRGGTANCTIVQSDKLIGSPAAEKLDVLCAMNQPSLMKFVGRIKAGGVLMANSSLVDTKMIERKDIKIVEIDADNLAFEIGNSKVANIIMLAAYMRIADTMPIDMVKSVVMKKMSKKPEFAEMNSVAFDKGVEIAEKSLNA